MKNALSLEIDRMILESYNKKSLKALTYKSLSKRKFMVTMENDDNIAFFEFSRQLKNGIEFNSDDLGGIKNYDFFKFILEALPMILEKSQEEATALENLKREDSEVINPTQVEKLRTDLADTDLTIDYCTNAAKELFKRNCSDSLKKYLISLYFA